MSNWTFETVTNWNDIWADAHISRWMQHYQENERMSVFLHPVLIKAWVDTYMPLRKMFPVFVWAKSTDGEVAFLPMVLWRNNWKNAFVRHLVPAGYSDYDYHNPISTYGVSEDYWQQLKKYLSLNFKYDKLTIDGITDGNAVGGDWQKDEICPMLHLDNIHTQDDVFKFLKTSLRGDIRRQMRRLNEIGELSYHEFKCWEEIPKSTFDTFMSQHALRWPNAYKAPKFHENLLRAGLKAGIVHFSVMKVGDVEIAWHLGFEDHGRYFYYMPCGNQEYFKYSPVKVHLFHLICRVAELGYSVFDHLRGEENYKDGWSNDAQYVNSLALNNEDIISMLKLGLLKLR